MTTKKPLRKFDNTKPKIFRNINCVDQCTVLEINGAPHLVVSKASHINPKGKLRHLKEKRMPDHDNIVAINLSDSNSKPIKITPMIGGKRQGHDVVAFGVLPNEANPGFEYLIGLSKHKLRIYCFNEQKKQLEIVYTYPIQKQDKILNLATTPTGKILLTSLLNEQNNEKKSISFLEFHPQLIPCYEICRKLRDLRGNTTVKRVYLTKMSEPDIAQLKDTITELMKENTTITEFKVAEDILLQFTNKEFLQEIESWTTKNCANSNVSKTVTTLATKTSSNEYVSDCTTTTCTANSTGDCYPPPPYEPPDAQAPIPTAPPLYPPESVRADSALSLSTNQNNVWHSILDKKGPSKGSDVNVGKVEEKTPTT